MAFQSRPFNVKEKSYIIIELFISPVKKFSWVVRIFPRHSPTTVKAAFITRDYHASFNAGIFVIHWCCTNSCIRDKSVNPSALGLLFNHTFV